MEPRRRRKMIAGIFALGAGVTGVALLAGTALANAVAKLLGW